MCETERKNWTLFNRLPIYVTAGCRPSAGLPKSGNWSLAMLMGVCCYRGRSGPATAAPAFRLARQIAFSSNRQIRTRAVSGPSQPAGALPPKRRRRETRRNRIGRRPVHVEARKLPGAARPVARSPEGLPSPPQPLSRRGCFRGRRAVRRSPAGKEALSLWADSESDSPTPDSESLADSLRLDSASDSPRADSESDILGPDSELETRGRIGHFCRPALAVGWERP